MATNSLSVYSLAIMPSAPIALRVKEMKQAFRAKLGKSYGSVNSDAHISLDGFEADAAHYPVVLAEYRRLVSGLSPFRIAFSGLAHFEGYFQSFYIQLAAASAETVRSHYGVISSGFSKSLKKQLIRKWTNESKVPHMTIGRRLDTEAIQLAYSLFTAFEDAFECEAFVIRKYDEKQRQYEVIDTLPLQGLSGQLPLWP